MKNRNILSTFFFSLLLLVCGTTLFAQGRVNVYTVTTPTLTWNDIGADQGGSGITIYSGSTGYGWRGIEPSFSLPFAINYDNTIVPGGTTVYFAGGGGICFGNSAMGQYNTYGGMTNTNFPGRIFPFGCGYVSWGDGGFVGSTTFRHGIYYTVTGTAPNRVLTIQCNGVHSPGAGAYRYYGTPSDIQVKIFEATGVIQILYHIHGALMNPYNYYSGGAVGLNGFTSPNFVYLSAATGLTTSPSTDYVFTPPPPPAQLSLVPKGLNFGQLPVGFSTTLTATANSVGTSPLHI